MARGRGLLALGLLLSAACLAQAQVTNTRARLACLRTPAAPQGLRASVRAEGSIALAWAGGDGCASPLYQITVGVEGSPAERKTFQTQAPSAVINGLTPSAKYVVEVRALGSRGASAPATLTVRPTAAAAAGASIAAATTRAAAALPSTDGWTCVPAQGYTPCSAAGKGLCTAISCADMARLGRCSTSFLRVLDWANRTVTQHCAAECGGCGAAAALGQARPVDLIAPPHDFCCAFGAGQYYAGGAASSAAEF